MACRTNPVDLLGPLKRRNAAIAMHESFITLISDFATPRDNIIVYLSGG